MRTILVVVVALAATAAAAQSAVEKTRLGRTVWSAFQCGTYAEMSGDAKEQARLFEVGIRAGRDFLDALNKGQMTPDVVRKEVPIGVTMLLQGPSPDFILGRIFENAMQEAFDDIVKKENGLPLDTSKWVRDEELRKSKAKLRYLNGNCVLVQ